MSSVEGTGLGKTGQGLGADAGQLSEANARVLRDSTQCRSELCTKKRTCFAQDRVYKTSDYATLRLTHFVCDCPP